MPEATAPGAQGRRDAAASAGLQPGEGQVRPAASLQGPVLIRHLLRPLKSTGRRPRPAERSALPPCVQEAMLQGVGQAPEAAPEQKVSVDLLPSPEDERCQLTHRCKQSCALCGVTKTPMWRHNPADGSKTLCNACGVKQTRQNNRAARQQQPQAGGRPSSPRSTRPHSADSDARPLTPDKPARSSSLARSSGSSGPAKRKAAAEEAQRLLQQQQQQQQHLQRRRSPQQQAGLVRQEPAQAASRPAMEPPRDHRNRRLWPPELQADDSQMLAWEAEQGRGAAGCTAFRATGLQLRWSDPQRPAVQCVYGLLVAVKHARGSHLAIVLAAGAAVLGQTYRPTGLQHSSQGWGVWDCGEGWQVVVPSSQLAAFQGAARNHLFMNPTAAGGVRELMQPCRHALLTHDCAHTQGCSPRGASCTR